MTSMTKMEDQLEKRFGDAGVAPTTDSPDVWHSLAGRGSVRCFKPEPIDNDLIRRLCAIALSAPSKSDLQQRDIIHVHDADQQMRIKTLLDDQAWTGDVPSLLIFCGNNRRQRQLHDLSGHPFVNDHLDAFFNASVDAGIALSAFIIAAEAIGLGCCPISAVRNRVDEMSAILKLPSYTFPVAGLAVGWPEAPVEVSPRLPLSATVHENVFDESGIADTIAAYDTRREAIQPYTEQRREDRFGTAACYGWSEEKARQYAEPERTDFGAYIRKQGFKLD